AVSSSHRKRSVISATTKTRLAGSSSTTQCSKVMMYALYVPLVLMLAVYTEAYSIHGNSNNPHPLPQEPDQCHSPKMPCRMNMTFDSEQEGLTHWHSYLCSCGDSDSCSTDWTQSDRVVSRQLDSTTYSSVVLDLMYCEPVRPRRMCVHGETALVLSSSLENPMDLDAYNCRCKDGVPFQLQRSWIRNFYYVNEFSCEDQMPTCPMLQIPCVSVIFRDSSFICNCPAGTECDHPDPTSWLPGTAPLLGYCRPKKQ
ncbi:hypothetical protein EGW08_009084, partial [Elysia chlorotica]